jgi:hypothetical protein
MEQGPIVYHRDRVLSCPLPLQVTHQEIYKYHPLVEEAEIYRELKEMNMTKIFA